MESFLAFSVNGEGSNRRLCETGKDCGSLLSRHRLSGSSRFRLDRPKLANADRYHGLKWMLVTGCPCPLLTSGTLYLLTYSCGEGGPTTRQGDLGVATAGCTLRSSDSPTGAPPFVWVPGFIVPLDSCVKRLPLGRRSDCFGLKRGTIDHKGLVLLLQSSRRARISSTWPGPSTLSPIRVLPYLF